MSAYDLCAACNHQRNLHENGARPQSGDFVKSPADTRCSAMPQHHACAGNCLAFVEPIITAKDIST